MLMYNYEYRIDKDSPIAQIYFRDLDRTYHYNRKEYGGKCDTDFNLVKEALRSLVNAMINQRQLINTPEYIVGNPCVCPLDWQSELRLRLSNWFLVHALKSFEDISKDYKFRTELPLSVKVIGDLFDATQELDLQLVFELVNTFKIPFKIKAMEMELG
jgi:hypothetical protein